MSVATFYRETLACAKKRTAIGDVVVHRYLLPARCSVTTG
jgi:hypothetical protein